MGDPREGVAADGMILTGASRHRVPAPYEPLLAAVDDRFTDWPDVSVYLYGSVATGQAHVGRSDVDLLTIDLPSVHAAELSAELGARFRGLCRTVDIGPARADDLRGEGDPSYGLRVFLRHYCVHLVGPNRGRALPAYPADVRAARGFNGDIAQHLASWRATQIRDEPVVLGRRLARKTLLAVAGLVSVLRSTWTTDRERAARAYAVLRPSLAGDLSTLVAWACGDRSPDRESVGAALRPDGVVEQVVVAFAETIGLWSPT